MNEESINTFIHSVFNTQKLVRRYDNWYEKYKFAYLSEINAIEKIIPKKVSGLEVGVGTGRFASVLNVPFGIDPAKESLKISHQRGVEVALAVGENLPFKNEIFDYLLMVISLSFLHDPRKALLEAKRVLKQKGEIIIGIVDKNGFLGKLYQKKKAEGHPFYREAILFSPSEVIDFLEEADFKILEIYQTIFRLPNELKNVQQPKKGYGDGAFVIISAKKMVKYLKIKQK